MKRLIILLFAVIIYYGAWSQSCLPDGITFTSKAQIDSFRFNYPGCTVIEGDVSIIGDKISNLLVLSVLTSIGGELLIEWNSSIIFLNGLENITSIGRSLTIYGSAVTSMTGLKNLTSIGGSLQIYESAVNSLAGLKNLTSVGGSLYFNGSSLSYLTGLENLKTVGGSIDIFYNNKLKNLSSLNNLDSIGGGVTILGNPLLESLSGLENLKSIGGVLRISSNPMLTSLAGLENINAASISELSINDNSSLSNCKAQSICDYLVSSKGAVNIHSNAPGCNNSFEVADSCGIELSCLTNSNYFFYNQTDIDSFQINYPNCTELNGDIVIQGDINNLNGLANITSVNGRLEINYATSLTSLNGLCNLSFVGGDFTITGNRDWWSGACISPPLKSLAGLEKLTAIGGSFILSCLEIQDFSGLDKLNSIGGDLRINYTDISNFAGMENLLAIGGGLFLGFWQAQGGSSEGNNPYLTSFAGLNNLNFIGSNIEIWGQQSLTSLTGLDKVKSIKGDIIIHRNNSLITLTGLDSLASIDGSLNISGNDLLTSLMGLDKVISIAGSLSIYGNEVLSSLKGIENISPGSINSLYITYNPMLSNCAVKSICDYVASPTVEFMIENNAPGCNKTEEVAAACQTASVHDFIPEAEILIYPNPATNKISISTDNLQGETTICIYNMNGAMLQQEKFQSQNLIEMDVNTLAKGIYLVKIQTNKGIETKRLVVQ